MLPKILTIVGALFLLLSLAGVAISIGLPLMTNGRTSWEEAAPGYIGGGACSCISFLMTVGGVVWWRMGKGKGAAT